MSEFNVLNNYLNRKENRMETQAFWNLCIKCKGLFFAGNPNDQGYCPSGGQHEIFKPNSRPLGDIDVRFYKMEVGKRGLNSTTQDEWCWCRSCQGLFFAGHPKDQGKCPTPVQVAMKSTTHLAHDNSKSGPYVMHRGDGDGGNTSLGGFKYCNKCHGLFFDEGKPTNGTCPAGGEHDSVESGTYEVMVDYSKPMGPQP